MNKIFIQKFIEATDLEMPDLIKELRQNEHLIDNEFKAVFKKFIFEFITPPHNFDFYNWKSRFIVLIDMIFKVEEKISTPKIEKTIITEVKVTNSPNTNDEIITINDVTFKIIYIKGGTFQMGNEEQNPIHTVTLTDFYMMETQVTQDLYEAIMGKNPSYLKGKQHPVEMVSWNDAQSFITKINALDILTNKNQKFALSSEAQWEYAARGGNLSENYNFAGSNDINEVAWYTGNSEEETKPVKNKKPNELGLYDMSGNVWEWCEDNYDSKYYQSCYDKSIVTNPINKNNNITLSIIRGGSYFYDSDTCVVGYRDKYNTDDSNDDISFRCVVIF